MEITNVSFGKLIRQLREERGISQDKLAEITTLSKAYLSRIENEERKNPSIFTIIRIKNALNIDIKIIEKLFEDDDFKQVGEDVESIDSMLLNSTYIFANKVATIDVQITLRDLIKDIEKYCVKETNNRHDGAILLELADKLRIEIKKSA